MSNLTSQTNVAFGILNMSDESFELGRNMSHDVALNFLFLINSHPHPPNSEICDTAGTNYFFHLNVNGRKKKLLKCRPVVLSLEKMELFIYEYKWEKKLFLCSVL